MTKLRIALVSFLVFLGIVAADVNFNESRAVLKAVATASLNNQTFANPTFTGTVTATGTTYTGGSADFTTVGVTSNTPVPATGLYTSSSFLWLAAGSAARWGVTNTGVFVHPNADLAFARAGANAFIYGAANALATGAATARTEINKAVTGIANNTATDVFTVTVPNAAHSAGIEVIMVGSLGAGGAIGANEATATTKYLVSVARTAGANAVAVIGAADGSSGSAAVSGAATITVTADLGSVSGAAGATNTFTIRVTIARGSGSSTNHTVMAYARLLNANATGVTIS